MDNAIPVNSGEQAVLPATLTRVAESIAHLGFKPINHVLSQHQWARDKLAMHSGKTVRIGVAFDPNVLKSSALPEFVSSKLAQILQDAPTSVDAHISNEGTLIALPLLTPSERLLSNHPVAVTMLVKPTIESLKGAISSGASGLQPHLSIDGEVMLAAALGEIAQNARWDFEDDLSFVLGDKVAHRLGNAISSIDAQAKKLSPKLMPHLLKGLDQLSLTLEKLAAKLPAR
jgi:ubiquinone biosynthesis accessory factor UbiJ